MIDDLLETAALFATFDVTVDLLTLTPSGAKKCYERSGLVWRKKAHDEAQGMVTLSRIGYFTTKCAVEPSSER